MSEPKSAIDIVMERLRRKDAEAGTVEAATGIGRAGKERASWRELQQDS